MKILCFKNIKKSVFLLLIFFILNSQNSVFQIIDCFKNWILNKKNKKSSKIIKGEFCFLYTQKPDRINIRFFSFLIIIVIIILVHCKHVQTGLFGRFYIVMRHLSRGSIFSLIIIIIIDVLLALKAGSRHPVSLTFSIHGSTLDLLIFLIGFDIV